MRCGGQRRLSYILADDDLDVEPADMVQDAVVHVRHVKVRHIEVDVRVVNVVKEVAKAVRRLGEIVPAAERNHAVKLVRVAESNIDRMIGTENATLRDQKRIAVQ